jgi:hypothetical protein
MTALVFDNATHRWDFDRFAMAFIAHDGEKRVLCLISGEALEDHFGAIEGREGMEAAFLGHRDEIESKAREMYRQGRVDEQGRVLLRSTDFARAGRLTSRR